ncbi:MAG TPA: transglycosylase SLT domain-containing protein, partial [Candidatus Deferrimicrobium sp.]|nr:transglycosylase SLT domain-containing protein [Candidatus Deferrimicrobium sp.]
EWEGAATLQEPQENIKVGTRHLFELIVKFGDLKQALVSYNMGEGKVRSMIRDRKSLPKGYVTSVLETYRKLKETYKV